MTVGDLKRRLADVPDNRAVMIYSGVLFDCSAIVVNRRIGPSDEDESGDCDGRVGEFVVELSGD